MIWDLFKTDNFVQENRGTTYGSIYHTKSIDPVKNIGHVLVSPRAYTVVSDSDIGSIRSVAPVILPSAQVNSLGTTNIYAFTDDALLQSGTFANDTWTLETGTNASTVAALISSGSDAVTFNDKVYIVCEGGMYSKANDSTTYTLVSNTYPETPRNNLALCQFEDRLYLSSASTKVLSMTTAESFSATGSYTLDLSDAGVGDIIAMRATSDGIWIGTKSINSNDSAEMILWDGVTENAPSKRIKIPARAIMSIVVKDDVPYIVDSRGIIRGYNQTSFVEVGRLPLNEEMLVNANRVSTNNWRFMHKNGMAVYRDEILMLVNNKHFDSTVNNPENMPSGVYAYHPTFGTYHKYGLSRYTGTGTATDIDQIEVGEVGALAVYDQIQGNTGNRTNQAIIIASASLYTDNENLSYNICIVDKEDSYDKSAILVTKEIQSQQFVEAWQSIATVMSGVNDITWQLKYRTEVRDYIPADIAWVDETTFTSTDDLSTVLSNFNEGIDMETEFVRGDGAGWVAHVSNISEAGGTYTVTIDQTITGMTTNAAKVRFGYWNKIDSDTVKYKQIGVNQITPSIQYKLFVKGSGADLAIKRLVSVSEISEYFK